ncbi:hypothetical protein FACS189490_00590 [Clostridia bacterium]|nr:hypothetical protein FACS189490_00590 [Clostridia bacterium]
MGKIFKPVPYRAVRVTGGFWQNRQRVNTESTVKAVYTQFKQTGRFRALTHAWREGEADKPHIFYDSDAAKWIEGAAYSLFFTPDETVTANIEAVIDLIEDGITAEGYFNSYYQTVEPHKRFTARWAHELYCAGHLIEAAVAYYEASGKRRFLDVMIKYAEYIYKVFVTDKSAAFETPGHEEIELALVRLYECVGDKKWLDLAKHFIDKRAANEKDGYFLERGRFYTQDQAPVAEQETAEGHAVRFGYLFTGAADIARETDDAKLLSACKKVWRDIIDKKMYVTGGIGSIKQDEAFGPPYFLPNFEAYTETCASIALAYFGERLSRLEAISEYADVCELELYNGALAGVSLDGAGFFYENPLSIKPSVQRFLNDVYGYGRPVQRVEVFSCSCCPPNILRLIASVGGYFYGVNGNTLLVHQYGESEAKITVNGREITVSQKTDYPWDGKITLTIGADEPFTAAIGLRVPDWCENPQVNYEATLKDGYLYTSKEWKDGDEVTLNLPMEVTEIEANPAVSQDAGRVAIKRGPIVYCVEGADNGENLEDLLITDYTAYETVWKPDLLGGVNVIKFNAKRRKPFAGLYRKYAPEYEDVTVTAIPYFAWANRAEGEMAVWLRRS